MIELHPHSYSLARRSALVRGKHRCTNCGHRLWIDGIPPVESRSLPMRTWPLEIIDRRRARALWR